MARRAFPGKGTQRFSTNPQWIDAPRCARLYRRGDGGAGPLALGMPARAFVLCAHRYPARARCSDRIAMAPVHRHHLLSVSV